MFTPQYYILEVAIKIKTFHKPFFSSSISPSPSTPKPKLFFCNFDYSNNIGDMGKSKKSQRVSKTKRSAVECPPPKQEDEICQIPSDDENPELGFKKWIKGYYQSRPGLDVLQEKIDDFITAHEAEEEQARTEREEKAADGGWTVVVHHKGRKKTTDAESGIAVGSVAQAAVMDKMGKKKNKDVGLDFYRFQKREAKRNEIMMLQSKFEQDKKRMQELRAQRKFRPY